MPFQWWCLPVKVQMQLFKGAALLTQTEWGEYCGVDVWYCWCCCLVCRRVQVPPDLDALLPYTAIYHAAEPPDAPTGAYIEREEAGAWIVLGIHYNSHKPLPTLEQAMKYLKEVSDSIEQSAGSCTTGAVTTSSFVARTRGAAHLAHVGCIVVCGILPYYAAMLRKCHNTRLQCGKAAAKSVTWPWLPLPACTACCILAEQLPARTPSPCGL